MYRVNCIDLGTSLGLHTLFLGFTFYESCLAFTRNDKVWIVAFDLQKDHRCLS